MTNSIPSTVLRCRTPAPPATARLAAALAKRRACGCHASVFLVAVFAPP